MENDLNSVFKYVVKRKNMNKHFYEYFKKAVIDLESIACWFDNIKSSHPIPTWIRYSPAIVLQYRIFANSYPLDICVIDNFLTRRGEKSSILFNPKG